MSNTCAAGSKNSTSRNSRARRFSCPNQNEVERTCPLHSTSRGERAVVVHRCSTRANQVGNHASAEEGLSRVMTVAIEMGHTTGGTPATLDLEELLATR